MANFTLYKFQIELADIHRAVYRTLEFRTGRHPSESMPYFLTRVLAYVLNYEEDLSFAPTGLHDPDAAAIGVPDHSGGFRTLIEIGNPSARKLHKATKAAQTVKVYTYKSPKSLLEEIVSEKVHRGSEVEIFSLSPSFLAELELLLKTNNRWDIVYNEETVSVQVGEIGVTGELTAHHLETRS